VPEPSTLGLLTACAVMLLGRRNKERCVNNLESSNGPCCRNSIIKQDQNENIHFEKRTIGNIPNAIQPFRRILDCNLCWRPADECSFAEFGPK